MQRRRARESARENARCMLCDETVVVVVVEVMSEG